MGKTYILDTNILLVDPKAFLSFKKNNVVIPYIVVEELERQKHTLGETGMNARDCSRRLAALLKDQTSDNLKKGIKLENGGTLIVISSADYKDAIDLGHKSKPGDDYILTVCVGLRKEKKNVFLVSNDTILRLRASSFGIATETYDAKQDIKSLHDLYQGYTQIDVDDEILGKFWEEQTKNTESFNVSLKKYLDDKVYPNDFVVLNSPKKKPYALLRTKDRKKPRYDFVREQKLHKVTPQNIEQVMAIELLMDPKIHLVTLTGISGTGKTLLSLAAGLEQVIDKNTYDRMIIIRPIHPTGKDLGFLPGGIEEKLDPWLTPIRDNLKYLMPTVHPGTNGKKKASGGYQNFEYLIDKGQLEIEAITYIRGRSIRKSYILIDEAQNISSHELKAIVTRAGKGSKVVLTGDIEQTDRTDVDSVSNGLSVAIEKFKRYAIAGHVSLKEGIRSELSALAAQIL